MAIRFVNRSLRHGRIVATLDDAQALFQGANGSPPGRTGVITSQLDNAGILLQGLTSHAANRTGQLITTLDSAAIALSGTSSSPGTLPSAPAGLTITRQGTSRNDITWQAAAPGGSPIVGYEIARNGVVISGVVSTLSYSDTTATKQQVPTVDDQTNIYYYQVRAVDSKGVRGPFSTFCQVWLYRGSTGGSTCGQSDFSYGIAKNWTDTTGVNPNGGPDIKAVFTANVGGGFQPYSNVPLSDNIYCLDIGWAKRFRFWLKTTVLNSTIYIAIYSRLAVPGGDVYTWRDRHVSDYVVMVAGQWALIDLPLSDLNFGDAAVTASIGPPYSTASDDGAPLATMTVTAKDAANSTCDVDNGAFVLNTGLSGGVMVVGTDGYHSQGSRVGSVGTYIVRGPSIVNGVTVSSRAMKTRRSDCYKVNIGRPDNSAGTDWFFGDMGFYTP